MDEIQARKRQVTECERALEALCKVTACFQQMAISIGSNSDGSFLREEMDETRALAHRICTGKATIMLLNVNVRFMSDPFLFYHLMGFHKQKVTVI